MHTRDRSAQESDVEIRDIIVVQTGGSQDLFGEFSGSQLITDSDKQTAANESGGSLIGRMIAHINEVASQSKQIHLNENFILPEDNSTDEKKKPIVRPDKKNCITRVSFQEFHFYPYRKRGPLTMQEFTHLLDAIEHYAESLPENMHIVIATIPIIDENKRVYNMAIYVQSGNPVKLNSFAKNLPSDIDLEYKNTTMPIFSGGSRIISIPAKIEKIAREIKTDLLILKKIDMKKIDKLLAVCSANTDFTYSYLDDQQNDMRTGVIPAYQQLLSICHHIKELSNNAHSPSGKQLEHLNEELESAINAFNKHLKVTDKKYVRHALQHVKQLNMASISLPERSGDASINYDGIVECTTSGGERFLSLIDICLDHAIGAGYSKFEQMLIHAEKNRMQLITNQLSHVVTSNTIDLADKLSLTRFITHADARYPSIQQTTSNDCLQADVIDLQTSAFGGQCRLFFYPPVMLTTFQGLTKIRVDLHNLRVELNRLENAKSQHKVFNTSAENRIVVLKRKIHQLDEIYNAHITLDHISDQLKRIDLAHLSLRPWLNYTIERLADNIKLISEGNYDNDLINDVMKNIRDIKDEWSVDAFSKHDALDQLLDQINDSIAKITTTMQPPDNNISPSL